MKRVILLIVLLIFKGISLSVAQEQNINIFQNGCRVYVTTKCEDLPSYDEMIKSAIAEETDWRIVKDPSLSDLIIRVISWKRFQVAADLRDFYVILEKNDGTFLWRSPIEQGIPTIFNGYDYNEASIKKLIKVLKGDAKKNIISGSTYYNRISDYTNSDNYQKAMEFFSQAISFSDEYKYDEAIKCLKKSIKFDPSISLAHKLMAILYIKKGKYGDAVTAIEECMKYDPYNEDNDELYYYAKTQGNQKFMNRINNASTIISTVNAVNSSITNNTYNANTMDENSIVNSHNRSSSSFPNYQYLYHRYEKSAKSAYEGLTAVGYKIQDECGHFTGGHSGMSSTISQMGLQKSLTQSQQQMRTIRLEALKYGINIQESQYETVSVH